MQLFFASNHIYIYIHSADTSQNIDRGVSEENGNYSYLIKGVKSFEIAAELTAVI